MKANKGLQKFTETEKRIEALMSKTKVTQKDMKKMIRDTDMPSFEVYLSNLLNTLKGDELDNFLNKVDDIINIDTRNQLWEANHYWITNSISKHIEEYGKMPTKNEIAKDTGLSRQTVHKHLRKFNEHPMYAEQIQKFKFTADRVLAKVIKMAVAGQGNVKAARLYFEVMGLLNNGHTSGNTLIKNQNNYIQINGVTLSQEKIQNLKPEQIKLIEDVIKGIIVE
jgi:hypothetical protein